MAKSKSPGKLQQQMPQILILTGQALGTAASIFGLIGLIWAFRLAAKTGTDESVSTRIPTIGS